MDSKLLRAHVYLEDGNFEEAKKCAEDILRVDRHNAEAYLVLLMINVKVRKRTQLGTLETRFDGYAEYQEIMKSDNVALQEELRSYLNEIDGKNAKIRLAQLFEEKERQDKERENQLEREKTKALNRCKNLESDINNIRNQFSINRYSGVARLQEIIRELESIKSAVNDTEVIRKVDELFLQVAKLQKLYKRNEVLSNIAFASIIILGLGGFIVGRFVLGSFFIGCFTGMFGGVIGFNIWTRVANI